jgi:hypothetical protein
MEAYMKRYLVVIASALMLISGCSTEEQSIIKQAAKDYDGSTDIASILDTVIDVEVSNSDNYSLDIVLAELERLMQAFSDCVETVDSVIEPSNISEKITIKDFNGNVLYSIITEDATTIYVTVPQVNKTYIITGDAIEEYLYSFIEYGTGIKLQMYK